MAQAGSFDRHSTAEQVTAGLDLSGRTALVTGATSGVGLESARVLALRGAHVLVAGRTRASTLAACDSLPGHTTPLAADLGDLDAVADLCARVGKLGVPLDMLICNAGIMAPPSLERVRGLEKQFVVNHLSHFVMVNRLLPQVVAAPAGRIVMLSSSAHRWTPPGGIDFDNLTGEKGYDPRVAYGRSKLANGLVAFELARRLDGGPVTVNAVHPGLVLTNIIRYSSAVVRLLAPLVAPLLPNVKTPARGAATTCFVAAHPAVTGVTGRYYADCQVERPAATMEDPVLAARLWEVSAELTRPWLKEPA